MDYKNILLDGYLENTSNRENFSDYLFMKYQNAPKGFTPDLFFGGLMNVVRAFENDLKKQLNTEKRIWTDAIRDAKERGDKESEKRRKEGLAFYSIDNFTTNVGGKYLGLSLDIDQLNFFEKAIKKAHERAAKKDVKLKNNGVTGFNSHLSETEIQDLYDKMDGNFMKATPEDFEALLTGKSLAEVRIKWIDTPPTWNKPNKQTIYEFIYLLRDKGFIDEKETKTDRASNNLYRKLEKAFFEIPHIKNVDPGKCENNTRRKKQLKQIIDSIRPEK